MTTLPDIEQSVWGLKDGDTLVLPAGAYPGGGVRKAVFPNGVTITAEPGTTLGGLVLQGCAGITLKGLDIAVNDAQGGALICQGGERINLDTCKVHGSGAGDGVGVKFQGCPNSSVQACEIFNVGGGVAVVNSDHVTVADNSIHDIQVDGVQSTGSSFVKITGNSFTDFFPLPGDHSDAIQFFTANQAASATDIIITSNIYRRGKGQPLVQGVFMGNETTTLPYLRVLVSGNALMGTIWQGITVGLGDGVTIDDNLVVSFSDTEIGSWIVADLCTNGAVTNNQATILNKTPGSQLAWANNLVIPPPAPADSEALLTKWLNRHAAVSPPPVVIQSPPPAPAPPPPPVVDPRDQQIADLSAKVSALTGQLAKMTTAAAVNQAALAKANADLVAVTKRLAATGVQLTADEAKLAKIRLDAK